MKKLIVNGIWLLTCVLAVSGSAYTKTIVELKSGMRIKTSGFSSSWNIPNRGTCVDAKKDRWRLTACFYDKAFDNAAHAEGFLQYGSLSQENKEMVGEDLPDNALVYVSGNWTYPTHNIEIGDFDVYEADRVLCHDDPPSGPDQGDDCYFSAARYKPTGSSSIATFISTRYLKSGDQSKQILWIREFIRSIKFLPQSH
ncbi:hypothetical protein PPMP20_01775 [Paraburkholderia phymatum]|uniref:Uncharacterized protein n=1 Tax=Paraburkholderia phymatum (strain DSM 17167 / CIP 108236 / LMG 21445 / STM815) TaxID=391038 RepID=B2JW56_PARP8|nr:hypothetical protein [Paraburkholderia phymatum]ACC75183.1 hypothetical protein Bphy_6126 [Paraburkholderia phymatum STM815]